MESTAFYLGEDAPLHARAALRARLALQGVADHEAVLFMEDPPGTEVSRHADGSVTVYVPDLPHRTVEAGPFTPCSNGDWERLVAAASYWCGPGRRTFGDEANLRDLEDAVGLTEPGCRLAVLVGDIRLALRYCGWVPHGKAGGQAVWGRIQAAGAPA